jgi:EEF1A N-terminal glycine/lysine methyltransferase
MQEKEKDAKETPDSVQHETAESVKESTKAPPALRKIPSDVSISALRPASSSASNTPVTPTLTTGASVATDDEETDFQSAYSTSPRHSYGNFDNYVVRPEESDSEQGTPTTVAKEYLDDFGPSNRERASSNATAKGAIARIGRNESTITALQRGH